MANKLFTTELSNNLINYNLRLLENFTNPTYDDKAPPGSHNESSEYLATLPFPRFREELDADDNNVYDIYDAAIFGNIKRPDIAEFVASIGVGIPPSDTYIFPDYINDLYISGNYVTPTDLPSFTETQTFNEVTIGLYNNSSRLLFGVDEYSSTNPQKIFVDESVFYTPTTDFTNRFQSYDEDVETSWYSKYTVYRAYGYQGCQGFQGLGNFGEYTSNLNQMDADYYAEQLCNDNISTVGSGNDCRCDDTSREAYPNYTTYTRDLKDYYLVVGSEVIRITSSELVDSTNVQLTIERGVENTTISTHLPGQEVQFWDGVPDSSGNTTMSSTDEGSQIGTTHVHFDIGGSDGPYGFNCGNTENSGGVSNYSFIQWLGDESSATRQQFVHMANLFPGVLNQSNGYYIKVNQEWMRIYNTFFLTDSEDWFVYYVERGLLNSVATCHSAGELVQIWNGLPAEEFWSQETPSDENTSDDDTFVEEQIPPTFIKRVFENKPVIGSFGVYSYRVDETTSNYYLSSSGVPDRYDKFVGKDLYTTSVGNKINEAILDSKIQNWYTTTSQPALTEINPLRFVGSSYFKINYLNIINRGVKSRINDVYFRVYLFSEAFFNPYTTSGKFKSYTELISTSDGFRKDSHAGLFYAQDGPNYGEKKAPGNLIEGITVLDNMENGISSSAATGQYFAKYANFDPVVSMPKVTDIDSDDITQFLEEKGLSNPIYIAILMDGDQNPKHSSDRSRKQTVDVWQINTSELFNDAGGKVTTIEFDNHTNETFSSGGRTAAFSARKLSVTIDTTGGVDLATGDYNPPIEYETYYSDIDPPELYSSNEKDLILLDLSVTREIKQNIDVAELKVNEAYHTSLFADYLPYAEVNINTLDFQSYYQNQDERVLVSVPQNVELDFNVAVHPYPKINRPDSIATLVQDDVNAPYPAEKSQYFNNSDEFKGFELVNKYNQSSVSFFNLENIISYTNYDSQFTNRTLIESLSNSDYIYFVIDWDDKDNKFKSLDDFIGSVPRNEIDLINKRSENLYKFNTVASRNLLTNGYTSPGIKTIKSIMFNYDNKNLRVNDTIEPLRWKLITTRIFLDIPLNEFPDFGDVGGSDYTTIPWPYTTPVIGGTSQNSKYLKSIDDILAGGKISDNDLIDETFLIDSKENDELGKNIEKLDLEQVRFFNESYDMNRLLGITSVGDVGYNEDVNYLLSLPFPVYLSEFDYTQDNELTQEDVDGWYSVGRPDIGSEIEMMIDGTIPTPYGDAGGGFGEGTSLGGIMSSGGELYFEGGYAGGVGGYQGGVVDTDDDDDNPSPEGDPGDDDDDGEAGANATINVNLIYKEDGGDLTPQILVTGTTYRIKWYQYNFSGGVHVKLYKAASNLAFSDMDVLIGTTVGQYDSNYILWTVPFTTVQNDVNTILEGDNFRIKVEAINYDLSDFGENNFAIHSQHPEGTFADRDYLASLPFPNYIEEFDISENSSLDEYDSTLWASVNYNAFRPDIAFYLTRYLFHGGLADNYGNQLGEYLYPSSMMDYNIDFNPIPSGNGNQLSPSDFFLENLIIPNEEEIPDVDLPPSSRPVETFYNPTTAAAVDLLSHPYTDISGSLTEIDGYWDGDINKFSEESSVGQIFITDNQDITLKQNCKLEINTGNINNKSIYDSSGNSNKGLLIGDYKVKKQRKGESMRRDSFIKVSKKTGKTRGAL